MQQRYLTWHVIFKMQTVSTNPVSAMKHHPELSGISEFPARWMIDLLLSLVALVGESSWNQGHCVMPSYAKIGANV